MKTLLLSLMATLSLAACGSDGGGSASDSSAPVDVSSEGQNSPSERQSMSLATFADLPACDATTKAQLAYIQDEKQFYVCDNSWVKISIKGEDGSDGVDGVTTIKEVEATNKKNQWVDSLTGLTWLIGGGGDYSQAIAGCSGGYHVPTWAEAQVGIGHGLRAIAASIPATQNFWIYNNGEFWYATETSGLPNKFQVLQTAGYAIYCVK